MILPTNLQHLDHTRLISYQNSFECSLAYAVRHMHSEEMKEILFKTVCHLTVEKSVFMCKAYYKYLSVHHIHTEFILKFLNTWSPAKSTVYELMNKFGTTDSVLHKKTHSQINFNRGKIRWNWLLSRIYATKIILKDRCDCIICKKCHTLLYIYFKPYHSTSLLVLKESDPLLQPIWKRKDNFSVSVIK